MSVNSLKCNDYFTTLRFQLYAESCWQSFTDDASRVYSLKISILFRCILYIIWCDLVDDFSLVY